MRIYAKVIPRAGRNEVEKNSDESYRVRVTAAPERGKANEAVVELLAEYFNVPKSRVNIIAGKTARTKMVEIAD